MSLSALKRSYMRASPSTLELQEQLDTHGIFTKLMFHSKKSLSGLQGIQKQRILWGIYRKLLNGNQKLRKFWNLNTKEGRIVRFSLVMTIGIVKRLKKTNGNIVFRRVNTTDIKDTQKEEH